MPRPSPRPSPSRRRGGPRPGATAGRADGAPRPAPRTPPTLLIGAGGLLAFAVAVGAWVQVRSWRRDAPARMLAEARAATEAADRPRALAAWHAWNEAGAATAATLLIEAQLAGDLDRGRDAERIAALAARLDPAASAAWALRINRLRVLDRSVEAMELGLAALADLRTPAARRGVLKATTLATLAEVPDAEARGQLDRWIAADPDDVAARAARLGRIAAAPHPGDPDRPARIVALEAIVARRPADVAAREALAVALADAGEVARGRAVLGDWPPDPTAADPAGRGPRFDRLRGRWDLEYDRRPAEAAAAFGRALGRAPHDWKSHYGLARALQILGRPDQAAAEALAVARLRERLDPATLGPRLAGDLDRIDAEPPTAAAAAMADLAALCRGVGLVGLADAWAREAADGPPPAPRGPLAPPP